MNGRAVTIHEGGGATLVGDGIELARLVSLASALRLEEHGIKITRGFSARTYAREEYGFRGRRERVLEQVMAKIDEVQKASGTTSAELYALVRGLQSL